jgi:hypothetical protein
MVALIICVALLLIPALPLTFTWLRFMRQRTSRDFRGLLTIELPLFVVTVSYLLFFVFFGVVTLFLTFLSVHLSGDFHVHALVWSNIVASLVMSVLALIGKNSLRWRLAGSAAAVSFVWFVVGFSIFAVEQAGRWVV